MIGIYKFTNKLTGESYIGQSVNIEKRYNQHKNRYDKFGGKDSSIEDTYFHSMLRHYGFHNFDFEVLEECSKEQLNEKEIYYIALHSSLYPNGYNKNPGGNMPHTNAIKDIATVVEIQKLLRTSQLSNIELGAIYGVSDQTISDINTGRIWFDKDISYPIRSRKRVESSDKKLCHCCGKEIGKDCKTTLCNNCFNITRRKVIDRPDKETLYGLLLNNSFLCVGRMFGVSDNAVRKWCKSYGIPKDSKYYRSVAC